MNDLVEPNNRKLQTKSQAYSFNFYYSPTPNPIGIGTDGYRWVSSKNMDRTGLVYGFVLDANGKCLVSTSIEIKK